MDIELNQSDGDRVVTLKGEVTIQQAEQLRMALMEAFEAGDRVRVDLQRVTEVDLSCLQILCSAHRTSLANNKLISIGSLRAEVFNEILVRAGMRRHIGCPQDVHHTCLWSGGQ
jgi:anti-anti-sigma factor